MFQGYLIFPGGSFYDSMWQYGKRSGLGTFCYSNGVVFQGAWRDDLMHGKVRILQSARAFTWFNFCVFSSTKASSVSSES